MAGSYQHVTDERGALLPPIRLADTLDTQGDVYEAVREMFGMIWWLANGNPFYVEAARHHYREGLSLNHAQFGVPLDDKVRP